MIKKAAKKLSLSGEAVRVLSAASLADARGGLGGAESICTQKPTTCNRPD